MGKKIIALMSVFILAEAAAWGQGAKSLDELQQENALLKKRVLELERENSQLKKGSALKSESVGGSSFLQILKQVKYTLVESNWKGNQAVFSIIAINDGGDKEEYVSKVETYLMDQEGNRHSLSSATRRGFDLPYGIPARVVLVFDTLSPNTTHVPFLEIALNDGVIQFREVPMPYKADNQR